MLFVGSDGMPSEDKQFEVYKQAARAAAGQPVLIRTLDIGGDKPLPYLNLPREVKPFLGYRGAPIRRSRRPDARTVPRHCPRLGVRQRADAAAYGFLAGGGALGERHACARAS